MKQTINIHDHTAKQELSFIGGAAAAFIPSGEAIAKKAYFAFIDHGSADGGDLKDWYEAEARLIVEGSPARQTSNGRLL